MKSTYSIRNWNRHFENNRSRQIEALRWVPIPARHDGEKYMTLMDHPDAHKIFSAWVLMVQVAAQCDPRGKLLRFDGQPHTPASLSVRTRAPAEWFEIALPYLHKTLQWIDCE